MDVLDGGPVESLVGFFDVQFCGSPENPTDFQVSPPMQRLQTPLIEMLLFTTLANKN